MESIQVSGSIEPLTDNTVISVGSNPIGSEIGITVLNGTVFSARIWDTALSGKTVAELSCDLRVRFQSIAEE